MQAVRNAVIFVLVLGGAFLALSPKRRSLVAEKLAEIQRFASRRIADREARDDGRRATEAWESEGGASAAAGAELR